MKGFFRALPTGVVHLSSHEFEAIASPDAEIVEGVPEGGVVVGAFAVEATVCASAGGDYLAWVKGLHV